MLEHECACNRDKDQHDRDFHDHDCGIEIRRFLNTDDQYHSNDADDQESHDIEDALHLWQCRDIHPVLLEQRAHRGQQFPTSLILHQYVWYPVVTHVSERSGRVLRRNRYTKVLQEAYEISAPSGSHRRSAEGVLQHQVPSDDPGKNFAQSGVPVGVSRTGDRDQ